MATTWRLWRETIPGLTMNELGRRAGITSGRLSIIERGVAPSIEEAKRLRLALAAASEEAERACPHCGSVETTILTHEDEATGREQSIQVCARCGSDEP